ncbi:HEPN domain-containing protein [Thermoanaerobacterium butyriciformans]|uniref:HEPN domain-containing protein n=1 Tax=Thermoanaerobacterium butyriciformans TaxID=1702242 RepID=A0ABS4NET8_9THEO|nr:HEPN domain-containing protein [Thermoanaerobacterium butyriciformans]MBP2071543.1 HEPN domain-containing protein [Thermoanaerobacterium butyriciformans]
MNNITLAESYLQKAKTRIKMIEFLMNEEDYSDVIREAQEAVELALKGMLRKIGVEPPKQHDVGYLLIEYKDKFSDEVKEAVDKLASISKWLRKEREFSFYGDIDFIPTLEYTEEDARKAINDSKLVVNIAEKAISSQ